MSSYRFFSNKDHELYTFDYTSLYNRISHLLHPKENNYLSIESISEFKLLAHKYPFFNSEISLFRVVDNLSVGSSWPIHIDIGRRSCLNIPIYNCTSASTTYFYSQPNPFVNSFDVHYQYKISLVKGPLTVIDKFCLLEPTLISTEIPHSVENLSSKSRIILSWGSMFNLDQLAEKLSI